MGAQTDQTVNFILTAQDRATKEITAAVGTVAAAQRQLIDVSKQVSEATRAGAAAADGANVSLVRYDQSLRRAGAGVRVLAFPLMGELAPALGTTTSRMASVLAGAAVMPTAMIAVGAAVTGLAGLLIGKLVVAWQEAGKAQREFAAAAATGNIAEMTKLMSAQSTEALKLAGAYREAAAARARIDPRIEGQLLGPLSPGARERRAGAAAEAGLEEVAAQQRALELAAFGRGVEESEADVKRVTDQQEQQRIDVLKQQLKQRDADAKASTEERLREDRAAQAQSIAGWVAHADAVIAETDRVHLVLEALADQRLVDEALVQERILGMHVATADAVIAETERAQQAEVAILDRRLADERALLEQADKDREKMFRQAAVQAREEQARREREDPVAGTLAGIRTIEEEWAGLGRSMENMTRGTAQTIQQTLSSVLRGDGIGKDFAKQFMGTFTDEIARALTASLMSNVGSSIRRVFPSANGGGAAPSSGFFSTAAVDITAAPSQTVAGFTQQGYRIERTADGRTMAVPGMDALPSGLLGKLAPNGLMNLLNTPVWQLFSGGVSAIPGITAAELAGFTTSAGLEIGAGGSVGSIGALGGGQSATMAGTQLGTMTVGQALGVVGAVIGFGLSMYSAYQSGSPATGAMTGAVSGLAAGATIGSLFGPYGTLIGAGIGLFAGAGLGAGFGALGAGDQDHALRESREWQDATEDMQPLYEQLDAANTTREIYHVLARWTRPTPNSGVSIQTSVEVDGRRKFVHNGELRSATRASIDEFVSEIETVQVAIQLGVSAKLKAQSEKQLEEYLKGRVLTISDAESRIQVQIAGITYEVGGAQVGGSLITRQRLLTLAALREMEDRSLDVSVFVNNLYQLDDDVLEDFLRELARVDRDRAIGFFAFDPTTGVPFRVRAPRLEYRPGLPGLPGIPGRPLPRWQPFPGDA
jgi:hypothetical protein